jgi:hypothetical protein
MNKQELYEFMLSLNRSNFLDLTEDQKTSYDKFNIWFEHQYQSRLLSYTKENMEEDKFQTYKSKPNY